MRKDVLAAGARKASYGVTGKVDDEITLRNVAPEGSFDTTIPEVTPVEVKRKKFVPTKGVLLVRRAEAENPSGLLITETMEKERPAEGFVLEIGSEVDIPVGSHIVFGKYSGTEFRLNGEVLLLIEIGEIKGSIVDEVQPVVEITPVEVDWNIPFVARA